MTAEACGRRFWTVAMKDGQTIQFYAEDLEIVPSGGLVARGAFQNKADAEQQLLLGIAMGRWDSFYAASRLDGHAMCVERTNDTPERSAFPRHIDENGEGS